MNNMIKCIHCNGTGKVLENAREIIYLLVKNRTLYLTKDHKWHISRGGGGPISEETVQSLINNGLIIPEYDSHQESYVHCSRKTIALEKTIEQRRLTKNKNIVIYVEEE
jgi:hypothetical protein